jgi:hypothetical protein
MNKGDWVYHVLGGWKKVVADDFKGHYPICVGGDTFTKDGKFSSGDINPMIYGHNPFDLDDYPPRPDYKVGEVIAVSNQDNIESGTVSFLPFYSFTNTNEIITIAGIWPYHRKLTDEEKGE